MVQVLVWVGRAGGAGVGESCVREVWHGGGCGGGRGSAPVRMSKWLGSVHLWRRLGYMKVLCVLEFLSGVQHTVRFDVKCLSLLEQLYSTLSPSWKREEKWKILKRGFFLGWKERSNETTKTNVVWYITCAAINIFCQILLFLFSFSAKSTAREKVLKNVKLEEICQSIEEKERRLASSAANWCMDSFHGMYWLCRGWKDLNGKCRLPWEIGESVGRNWSSSSFPILNERW